MSNEDAQGHWHNGSNSNTRTSHSAKIDTQMRFYANLRENIMTSIFEGQWLLERIQRKNSKSLLSSDFENFLETCENIVSLMRKSSSKISFLEEIAYLYSYIENAHKFDSSSVAFENYITSTIKVLETVRGKIHGILENML